MVRFLRQERHTRAPRRRAQCAPYFTFITSRDSHIAIHCYVLNIAVRIIADVLYVLEGCQSIAFSLLLLLVVRYVRICLLHARDYRILFIQSCPVRDVCHFCFVLAFERGTVTILSNKHSMDTLNYHSLVYSTLNSVGCCRCSHGLSM